MATKFKGIYKSFKYITQIFVVKEREMEIGYPTDVKHVAHVGWDGPLGNGPSWMDDFNTAPDFSTSLGNLSELRDDSNPMAVTDLWSSQDSEQSSNIYNSIPSAGVPYSPEKSRQKKIKSATSSSSQSRPASSRRPKAAKSKAMYSAAREATPIALM